MRIFPKRISIAVETLMTDFKTRIFAFHPWNGLYARYPHQRFLASTCEVGDFTHYIVDDGGRTTGVVRMTSSTPSPVGEIRKPFGTTRDELAIRRRGLVRHPIQRGHHWGTVCPTDPDYRENLLSPDRDDWECR